MPDINKLPDISNLSDIETNFRVFAGPGAGKTTWLINHLNKVLKESKRLGSTRKIACITYTNVAAEEIINRLGCDSDRFDISTIHSFLYRNVVAPFSYLIEKDNAGEPLFNINNLNGHDEHIPHSDRIRRWKNTIEQINGKKYTYFNYGDNKKKLIKQIGSLDYSIDGGEVQLILRKYWGLSIPTKNNELWLYKQKYWSDGIMHHEDVLYFSHYIFNKSPRIYEFIRNKFPYIFIDEFQDTTELQTWIINNIAASDTIIGVIGDLAQSIYKFTGAKRSDFENFTLNDMQSFKIDKNHRSTSKIIDFLNCLRTDITQAITENTNEGEDIKLFVGQISNAVEWARENVDLDCYVLTRTNIAVQEIIHQTAYQGDNVLEQLFASDSNSRRANAILSILMGYKFFQKKYFKDAIRNAIKPIRSVGGNRISSLELRNIAIGIINELCDEQTREKTLFSFYMDLFNSLRTEYGFQIASPITNRSRPLKAFYENNKVHELLDFIKVDTKSDDIVRTIHSSKGTEFSNVLVHFESLKDFDKYVLSAPTQIHADDDDSRIYYVAFSRAKDRLILNIPEIKAETRKNLEELTIQYELVT